MPFNGSGTFVRVHDWTDDADAAINIRADRMDEEHDGMATGLSNCIVKDGQTTITANLPMAGYRHTGVGDASARTHYAVVGQIQDSEYNWADAGGSADVITATYSPAITTLVDGMLCYVRAGAANATTTPTFSPNGLTAYTIVKLGGRALAHGDIYGDGHELALRLDLTNTRWELLNPSKKKPQFSAYVSSTQSNVTGDTTAYTVPFDTEILDIGGNYNNSTYTFTAPIAGTYRFSAHVTATEGATKDGRLQIVTTNRAYSVYRVIGGSPDTFSLTVLANMSAGHTAYVEFRAGTGTKVVDIFFDASSRITNLFSGELVE